MDGNSHFHLFATIYLLKNIHLYIQKIVILYSPFQNDLIDEAVRGRNGTNGHHAEEAMDIDHGAGRPEKTSTAKPALKMTFAEYWRVSNLIILHMHKMDDSQSSNKLKGSFIFNLV
jgi:hypothetical protein